MSVNTAHANRGVLIHAGESILLHSKCVTIDFVWPNDFLFRRTKPGSVYLTSHRVIFRSRRQCECLQSFSAPFINMCNLEHHQSDFGKSISGTVRAQPGGNFIGDARFSLTFITGGTLEFAEALSFASSLACSKAHLGGGYSATLTAYKPPKAWYEAPVAAYQPSPDCYDWLPKHGAFSRPTPNSVFMCDNPAPFPGITTVSSNECASFDDFKGPPVYGVFGCSDTLGSFPHQAAFPVATPIACRVDNEF